MCFLLCAIYRELKKGDEELLHETALKISACRNEPEY
jgi:hypothetical protein